MADLYYCQKCGKSYQTSRSPMTQLSEWPGLAFCSFKCANEFESFMKSQAEKPLNKDFIKIMENKMAELIPPAKPTPADKIISQIEAVLDHLSGEQKTGYLLGSLIAARLQLESMDLQKMAKEAKA